MTYQLSVGRCTYRSRYQDERRSMSKYDDLEVIARRSLKSLEDAKSQKECAEYRPVIFNPETIIELIEIAKAAENMLLSTNRWEQQTLALRLAKLLGNPGIYATYDPEPPEAA